MVKIYLVEGKSLEDMDLLIRGAKLKGIVTADILVEVVKLSELKEGIDNRLEKLSGLKYESDYANFKNAGRCEELERLKTTWGLNEG